MNKTNKTPAVVIIAVLTLITIIFWAAFEIYRSVTTKPETPVSPKAIEPLNPTLDQTALSELQNRIHLNESEIGTVITKPSPTPISVATQSALPTPTP